MIASNMAAARREEAIAAQFRGRMIEVHGREALIAADQED